MLYVLLFGLVVNATTMTVPNIPAAPRVNIVSMYNIETIKVDGANVIFFNAQVNDSTIDAAVFSLMAIRSNDPIYFIINSPGGSVLSAGRLISYIKYSGKNIVTVCDNFCASMGFQIFQVGSRRLVTPKAMLMTHPSYGGAASPITENQSEESKAIKLYMDRLDADTAIRSKIPYERFKFMTLNNIWAETPEALALHLADGVVKFEYYGDPITIIYDEPQETKAAKSYRDYMFLKTFKFEYK